MFSVVYTVRNYKIFSPHTLSDDIKQTLKLSLS